MSKYCEKLTKEMLENWGFTFVKQLPDNDWYIERVWRKNSSKELRPQRIKVTEAVCRHKYSSDKRYLKLTFSTPEGVKSITLSRFIFVWFKENLEAGEVVDHIDNNPYNNRPENLQKLSVGENLAKRFIDNEKNNVNQYTTETYKNKKKLTEFVHDIKINGGSYELAVTLSAKFNKALNGEED